MRGHILMAAGQSDSGTIISDDGKQYPFGAAAWKENQAPKTGKRVYFALSKQGKVSGVCLANNTNLIPTLNMTAPKPVRTNNHSLYRYAVLCVTQNYFNFKGRARRREFWGFVLFNVLLHLLLGFVIGIDAVIDESLCWAIIFIGLIIPSLAVTVRRLHDIDRTGWWVIGFGIAGLIPVANIVATVIMLVFLCLDSQPETNRYGENPKQRV